MHWDTSASQKVCELQGSNKVSYFSATFIFDSNFEKPNVENCQKACTEDKLVTSILTLSFYSSQKHYLTSIIIIIFKLIYWHEFNTSKTKFMD